MLPAQPQGGARPAPHAAPPGLCAQPGGQHEAVNRAAGQRVRGSHPIQTVNQRHRQLQQFLLPFHGVATKCLGNYLRWHQEIGLASQPSPRACLPASLAPPMHTFRELSHTEFADLMAKEDVDEAAIRKWAEGSGIVELVKKHIEVFQPK